MQVAVVTPYCDEPIEWLTQCHESVKRQRHPATHIVVGDGSCRAEVDGWDVQHIKLPVRHADFGDTPRAIGSLSAAAQGFDAVTYLDADDWYFPEHIQTLVELHRATGAAVCTSRRQLHRLDGSHLGLCLNCEGEAFCSTSCLFMAREAFETFAYWALMPAWMHPIGDRVVWHYIKNSGLSTAHTSQATVAYRTKFHGHYEALGESPPAELGKRKFHVEEALERWEREGHPTLSFPLKLEGVS